MHQGSKLACSGSSYPTYPANQRMHLVHESVNESLIIMYLHSSSFPAIDTSPWGTLPGAAAMPQLLPAIEAPPRLTRSALGPPACTLAMLETQQNLGSTPTPLTNLHHFSSFTNWASGIVKLACSEGSQRFG